MADGSRRDIQSQNRQTWSRGSSGVGDSAMHLREALGASNQQRPDHKTRHLVQGAVATLQHITTTRSSHYVFVIEVNSHLKLKTVAAKIKEIGPQIFGSLPQLFGL